MLETRAARESAASHALLDHFTTSDAEEHARAVWSAWRCEPSCLPLLPPGEIHELKAFGITLLPPPAAHIAEAKTLNLISVQPPSTLMWRVVHKPHVMVRDTPGLGGRVLQALKTGSVIQVDGEAGGWLRLAHIWEDSSGWVLLNGSDLGFGVLLEPAVAHQPKIAAVAAGAAAAAIASTAAAAYAPTRSAAGLAEDLSVANGDAFSAAKRCEPPSLAELVERAGLPAPFAERLEATHDGTPLDVTAVDKLGRAAHLPVGMRLRLVLAMRETLSELG